MSNVQLSSQAGFRHSARCVPSPFPGRSEGEGGVVLPDFQKEALSVPAGLGESGLGIGELGLQGLSLQRIIGSVSSGCGRFTLWQGAARQTGGISDSAGQQQV